MYWFVIYAARSRTRARIRAPLIGPPEVGSWLSCAPPVGGERSIARYTAVLTEETWRRFCEELGLDLEQVCRQDESAAVCEAGPLPALLVDRSPVELPGVTATAHDMRKCVVGPLMAIALTMPDPPAPRGAPTEFEVGLCVAPLPESDMERERVRSLFALAAFNVGGAEAELRCPECASPELDWLGGPNLSEQMRCNNCGESLPRECAFLRLGDCEGILATAPRPPIALAAAAPAAP